MKKLFILLIVCLASLNGFAQSQYKYLVGVEVQHDDKAVADTIESYINRELRSLNDVEIVDETSATFVIRIMAIDSVVGTHKIGYAFSTTITFETKCVGLTGNYNCSVYDDAYLSILPTQNVSEKCRSIVTKFDIRSLKPLRELRKKKT